MRAGWMWAAALLGGTALNAKAPPPPLPGPPYSYVELADLALGAPVVVAAMIMDARPVPPEAAGGVAPGMMRMLVGAGVDALIAGRADVPPSVTYLADVTAPGGKRPKLKGQAVLLLARPGPRGNELQLVSPRAQVPRTTENESRLRAILSAAVARDAPPAITGVGHAFHVAGSLPGEGETQVFLKTADNRPISLSILRRPGEQAQWSVALSELTDASAKPPAPDTLLWYRLACGLPAQLPADAAAGQEPADAQAAADDYAVVMKSLGPCVRSGGRPAA